MYTHTFLFDILCDRLLIPVMYNFSYSYSFLLRVFVCMVWFLIKWVCMLGAIRIGK